MRPCRRLGKSHCDHRATGPVHMSQTLTSKWYRDEGYPLQEVGVVDAAVSQMLMLLQFSDFFYLLMKVQKEQLSKSIEHL